MDVSRDSLKLSFGQVAWVLAYARPPQEVLLDRLRYLRQLHVPFSEEERKGSGNRMVYRFEHLVECGLGIEGLKRRIRPKDVATIIVTERKRLHALAQEIFDEIDPTEFERVDDTWRKPTYPPNQERYLRFHDRDSHQPFTLEELGMGKAKGRNIAIVAPIAAPDIPLVQFKNCIVAWVGRALRAPETRAGRP